MNYKIGRGIGQSEKDIQRNERISDISHKLL